LVLIVAKRKRGSKELKKRVIRTWRGLEWQDFALIGLILFRLILLWVLYSGFNQLPSPIYGGDLYHQLAQVNHIKYGGNPFSSFSTLEGKPTYFPFYAFLVGNFARVFHLDGMSAMFISSYFFVALSLLLLYLVGLKIFKNKTVALAGVLMYAAPPRGILKYTEFARYVVYPLFFVTLLNFFQKKQKWLWAILTGIVFGIATLSHAMGLLFLIQVVLGASLYLLVGKYIKPKGFDAKGFKQDLLKNIALIAIIIGTGLAISLLHWSEAFTAWLSGEPLGNLTVYKYTFGAFLKFAFRSLFSFGSPGSGLMRVLFILGIIAPFVISKLNAMMKTIYIVSGLLLLLPFHFIITKPLFGFSLVPNHMVAHAYPIAIFLVSCLALYLILHAFGRYGRFVVYLILVLLLLFTVVEFSTYKNTNRWAKAGTSSLTPYMLDVAQWITTNTDVNDVFVTTKEIASAVNALTGRKFLTLKESHVDLFLDSFQREADLAVLLYGNDDSYREELIQKYRAKYFYWDIFWFRSEFVINEKGKLVSFFDPITVPASQKFIDYFDRFNISYIRTNMAIDPSKRDNNPLVKKEDVLVVLPAELNFTHPWSRQLDKYLKELVSFKDKGGTVAKIFMFKPIGK